MMPSPKMGTVTNDITSIVKQYQAGRVQFRVDKTGNVHAGIGKVSFEEAQLVENVEAICTEIMKQKPASVRSSCHLLTRSLRAI